MRRLHLVVAERSSKKSPTIRKVVDWERSRFRGAWRGRWVAWSAARSSIAVNGFLFMLLLCEGLESVRRGKKSFKR